MLPKRLNFVLYELETRGFSFYVQTAANKRVKWNDSLTPGDKLANPTDRLIMVLPSEYFAVTCLVKTNLNNVFNTLTVVNELLEIFIFKRVPHTNYFDKIYTSSVGHDTVVINAAVNTKKELDITTGSANSGEWILNDSPPKEVKQFDINTALSHLHNGGDKADRDRTTFVRSNLPSHWFEDQPPVKKQQYFSLNTSYLTHETITKQAFCVATMLAKRITFIKNPKISIVVTNTKIAYLQKACGMSWKSVRDALQFLKDRRYIYFNKNKEKMHSLRVHIGVMQGSLFQPVATPKKLARLAVFNLAKTGNLKYFDKRVEEIKAELTTVEIDELNKFKAAVEATLSAKQIDNVKISVEDECSINSVEISY